MSLLAGGAGTGAGAGAGGVGCELPPLSEKFRSIPPMLPEAPPVIGPPYPNWPDGPEYGKGISLFLSARCARPGQIVARPGRPLSVERFVCSVNRSDISVCGEGRMVDSDSQIVEPGR